MHGVQASSQAVPSSTSSKSKKVKITLPPPSPTAPINQDAIAALQDLRYDLPALQPMEVDVPNLNFDDDSNQNDLGQPRGSEDENSTDSAGKAIMQSTSSEDSTENEGEKGVEKEGEGKKEKGDP